jgi:hypothetical protein
MIGWWPGHNFSVVARSLLISTINLGLPRDFNELRVAKIARFATSALTSGKQPLDCMGRADLCVSGEPLQSRSIQLCARRISDAGDPIKPLLREDIFSIRRRMPTAARQSSIRRSLQRNDSGWLCRSRGARSQRRLTTPPRYRCPLSTGYESLGSCPRAAGWSAATSCIGTFETCRRALIMSPYRGKPEVTGRRSK